MPSADMAAPWPPLFGWALAKGKGRDRHLRRDDLERLGPLRRMGAGPPFGAGPVSGQPFGGGRGRRRRGDVRIALLLLVAEEPRNGYQLMQTIEQRSDGRWRPSPGSVYPALAQLEDEGLIRATEREGSKLFEITEAGRAHLEKRAAGTAPWELDDDDPSSRTYSDLRALMRQVHVAAMQAGQAGSEQQIERAGEVLAETRRSLYRILAEDPDD
jgi:DNA-binding PadR family transcriptional regulator